MERISFKSGKSMVKQELHPQIKSLQKLKKRADDDIIEFVVFIKSLKVLLRTNRTMTDIVETLEHNSTGKFKIAMNRVRNEVTGGKSLSSAFRNTLFFPDSFCNIFEVGESTGKLEESLDSYIIYMSKTMGMRRTLQSAMTYPTVMLSVIAAAMIFIIFYVIPSFQNLVSSITAGMDDVELNLPTRIFFGIYDFFAPLGNVFPIVLAVLFIAYMFLKGKKQLAGLLERRIPKLRQVKNEMDWGQWLLLASVSLESGMLVSKTLNMLNENLPSELRLDDKDGTAYDDILFRVTGGQKLSDALKEHSVPYIISNSIAIAESSGNLWETMRDLAEIYLEGVDFKIKDITGVINPVLTIAIAIFVTFIVGGMMSVMASINTLISQA